MAPPSLEALLDVKVELSTLTAAYPAYMAPPLEPVDLFDVNVEPVMLIGLRYPLRAPPPPLAVFEVNVEFVTSRLPLLTRTAPPLLLELEVKVTSEIARLTFFAYTAPPPATTLALVRVSPLIESVWPSAGLFMRIPELPSKSTVSNPEPGPVIVNEEPSTVGRFDERVIVGRLGAKLMVEQSLSLAS
jgi:hypothetical protein